MVDAILSVVSVSWPGFGTTSDVLSNTVALVGVAVFVLAYRRKIQPRAVMLALPSFYFLMLLFSLYVDIMLWIEFGSALKKMEIDVPFLFKHYSWFPPSYWTILALWVAVGIFGIVGYVRSACKTAPPQ